MGKSVKNLKKKIWQDTYGMRSRNAGCLFYEFQIRA
jgi:hypothetical protein